MKKLFFTALVAVVAVGGAYARGVYPIGSTEDLSCPPGPLTCDFKMGSDFLVSNNPYPQDQSNQYLLSTISWDGLS